jgi:hypothetical protein
VTDFLDGFEETAGVVARAAGAQLEFHHSAQGLLIRVLAVGSCRLQINSAPVEAPVQVRIVGPAAAAFWATVEPAGRPVRSVEGLSFTYDASRRTLTLLVRSHRGNTVRLNGRELSRLELCLIGRAAGEIWASLQQTRGEGEDPFAGFEPERSRW